MLQKSGNSSSQMMHGNTSPQTILRSMSLRSLIIFCSKQSDFNRFICNLLLLCSPDIVQDQEGMSESSQRQSKIKDDVETDNSPSLTHTLLIIRLQSCRLQRYVSTLLMNLISDASPSGSTISSGNRCEDGGYGSNQKKRSMLHVLANEIEISKLEKILSKMILAKEVTTASVMARCDRFQPHQGSMKCNSNKHSQLMALCLIHDYLSECHVAKFLARGENVATLILDIFRDWSYETELKDGSRKSCEPSEQISRLVREDSYVKLVMYLVLRVKQHVDNLQNLSIGKSERLNDDFNRTVEETEITHIKCDVCNAPKGDDSLLNGSEDGVIKKECENVEEIDWNICKVACYAIYFILDLLPISCIKILYGCVDKQTDTFSVTSSSSIFNFANIFQSLSKELDMRCFMCFSKVSSKSTTTCYVTQHPWRNVVDKIECIDKTGNLSQVCQQSQGQDYRQGQRNNIPFDVSTAAGEFSSDTRNRYPLGRMNMSSRNSDSSLLTSPSYSQFSRVGSKSGIDLGSSRSGGRQDPHPSVIDRRLEIGRRILETGLAPRSDTFRDKTGRFGGRDGPSFRRNHFYPNDVYLGLEDIQICDDEDFHNEEEDKEVRLEKKEIASKTSEHLLEEILNVSDDESSRKSLPIHPSSSSSMDDAVSSLQMSNVKVYRNDVLRNVVSNVERCQILDNIDFGIRGASMGRTSATKHQQTLTLIKHIVAFLNYRQGGQIFIGLNSCGMAKGLRLDRNDRDLIRQSIDRLISDRYITPHVLTELIEVKFQRVEDRATKTLQSLVDASPILDEMFYLVIIQVSRNVPPQGGLYKMVDRLGEEGTKYVRIGGKLGKI